MAISNYDTEELAAKLLGFNGDFESVAERFYDKYGIDMDNFHKLICDLAPLCEVGQSLLSGEKSRGFADIENAHFIARVDA